jgi:hypothetical protein
VQELKLLCYYGPVLQESDINLSSMHPRLKADRESKVLNGSSAIQAAFLLSFVSRAYA